MGKKKRGLKPKFPLGRWIQTTRKIEGKNRCVWVKAYKKYGKRKYKVRLTNPYRAERSLLKIARYKKYKEIVSLKDPTEAKESVKELYREFHLAKTHAKKLRISRVTTYASNRAYASAKRKNISAKEREEFRQIGNIYHNLAFEFWRKL
nr:MAG: hypothetical protein [uncultured archaeon]